jgi:large subunit ribosomal protein L23
VFTMAQSNRILIRPVITERSTALQAQDKYIFEVALDATKIMIKLAVEKLFAVHVLNVNTVRTRGKTKRFGPRLVRAPEKKKAIITLKSGDRITIFEGV